MFAMDDRVIMISIGQLSGQTVKGIHTTFNIYAEN